MYALLEDFTHIDNDIKSVNFDKLLSILFITVVIVYS